MTYLADYVNYFEDLAKRHPDLQHVDADKERAFSAIYVEEMLGNFRNKLKPQGYTLHAIRYTTEGRDNAQNYKNLARQGGFIIMGYAKRTDYAQRIAVESACERIALEIIAKMCDDSAAGHPVFKYSLNRPSFSMQPLDGSTTAIDYCGYTVFFDFIVSNTVCTANVNWLPAQ